jgi:CheY-like chemotaxis protein
MMALKNILLVDDDKAFNFLNRIILKENKVDCNVAEALNGQQALNYLAANEECPDAILLDLNMPEMDGFEFLEEFEKLSEKCLTTRVYVLTSSLRDEDRSAALAYKVVRGYFDKPLSNRHIEEILAATA